MAEKRRANKQKSFASTFVPIFLIFLLVFTAGIFLYNKYGLFGLFKGDIMKDIHAIAGGDSDFAKKYSESKRINVLLLGENKKLTDTIMLASFDTELKRVDIVSVPRDTYYERSNYKGAAYQKINSIYGSEGTKEKNWEDGAVAMAKAVSNVLGGVPIHFYDVISDDGVAKIVDAMGGIKFNVPRRMKYTDRKQKLYIDLQKGEQVLNGDQAVQYLRYRKGYNTGDLGRVNAQQEFMKEAFKQSIGFGFPKVAKTVIAEVETNMAAGMAAKIASRAVGMEAKDIDSYVAPGEAEYRNGSSYYFVDSAETRNLMEQIYSMKAEEEGR
jgi:LCP family protein required for cell wall assembly